MQAIVEPPWGPARDMATVVAHLLHYLVVALMLSIGLAARPADLAELWRRPGVYLRALLVVEIGVPLLALLTVEALRLPPYPRGLILLMAICPGAPLVPFATRAKGETHSVVGLNLLVLTSLMAPLTIPAWLSILERLQGHGLGIAPMAVLRQVASVVLVPIAAGIGLRLGLRGAADPAARVVHAVFVVGLVLALAVALWVGVPVLVRVPPIVLLAVFVMSFGAVAMGRWAAARRPEAKRVTSVAAALGNPGLVLAIVAASRPGFRAAAFVAAYLIARKLALLPYELWASHRERARPRSTGTAIAA